MSIYKDDIALFDEMRSFAFMVANYLNVRINRFEAKSRPLPDVAVGLCYSAEKRICVTLRFRNRKLDGGEWWESPLDKRYIMETVIHEVCHLKHPNHGGEFKKLEKEIVNHFLKEEQYEC